MFWEQPFSAARRAAALGHWWVGRADGGNTGEVPRSLFWTISRRRKTYGSQGHGSAASLSLTRIQLVECALQFFNLLSSLAELAFRCQALVVGKVFGCFGNERVEIRCGLGRCGGGRCLAAVPPALRRQSATRPLRQKGPPSPIRRQRFQHKMSITFLHSYSNALRSAAPVWSMRILPASSTPAKEARP